MGKQKNKILVEVEKYNFYVNGRAYQFAENSLFLFSEDNPLRKFIVRIVTHKFFDAFILILILFNSILLGCIQYSCIDRKTHIPSFHGMDPMTRLDCKSNANHVFEATEIPLTVLFTLECVLKIIAMGFFIGPGAYLHNGWNWIDFIVVITSLLQSLPGMPNVSFLRTFRVLRPLRTLNRLPRMKILVSALLSSIPDLVNVMILLLFIFAIFGILALQFLKGFIHLRCRLTPYPVAVNMTIYDSYTDLEARWFIDGKPENHIVYDIVNNRDKFPFCHFPGNVSDIIPLENTHWNQKTSPWSTPRLCVWPTDQEVIRLCGGAYKCHHNYTCGSNWDKQGNARFPANDRHYLFEAEFYEDFGYGYPKFDSIIDIVIVIIQTLTLEGWSDIMYVFMDSYNYWMPPIWFTCLVLFGNYFLLNLMLAVIFTKFNESQEEVRLQQALQRSLKKQNSKYVSMTRSIRIKKSLDDAGPIRRFCYNLVTHPCFELFIVICILINTIVLALDMYPLHPEITNNCEYINFVLTLIFIMEMVLKMIAYKFVYYFYDKFNIFDMIVVIISIFEFIFSPPSFLLHSGTSHTSGVSALRSFRLFRLFKLARSWTSLQELFVTLSRSFEDILNFAVLLLLYLYIETLMGMQFFANEFHFDPVSQYQLQIDEDGYMDADIPRCRYDDFYYSLMTVFQHLAIDNYNLVMYDQRRATTAWSEIYTINLIVIGNWVVLNLFLAILLGNFDSKEEDGLNKKTSSMVLMMKSLIRIVKCCFCIKKVAPENSITVTENVSRLSQISQKNSRRVSALNHHSMLKHKSGKEFTNLATETSVQGAVIPLGGNNSVSVQEDNRLGIVSSPQHGIIKSAMKSTAWNSKHVPNAATPTRSFIKMDPKSRRTSAAILPPSRRPSTAKMMDGNDSTDERIMKVSQALNMPVNEKKELKQITAAAFLKRKKLESQKNSTYNLGTNNNTTTKDLDKRKSYMSNRSSRRSSRTSFTSDDGDLDYFIATVSVTDEKDIAIEGRSLWLFSPENWLRDRCARIVQNKYFENSILVLILISSITLAIENPLDNPESTFKKFLEVVDYILTALFGIEMVLKIITFGLVFGKHAYLRSPWNILDCFVVIISILAALPMVNVSSNLTALRALRAFRALRPLRVVSRNPGLKLVANALLSSVPGIGNICLIAVMFFLIFSIIGTNYFKGLNFGCSGDKFDSLSDEQQELIIHPRYYTNLTSEEKGWFSGNYTDKTSKQVCLWMGCEWISKYHCPQNFDNIIQSFSSFYQMTTTEGWQDIMYIGTDGTGIDMQPIPDNQKGWSFFFMAFIVIGAFFILNLFVGVVIENFNNMKRKLGKDHLFLTEEQRQWVDMQESLLAMKIQKPLKRPKNKYRLRCFNLVHTQAFDWFIMLSIIINTIFMACTHFGEPYILTEVLEILNYFFAFVFTVEAILKLLAYGLKQYFTDGWNIFDFLVTAGSDVGIILKLTVGDSSVSALLVVRMFRIGRIFRLIQNAKALRTLFNTLLLTLPSLANVGGILALMLFIYTVLGVQLFAKVKDGTLLDDRINFRNFGTALVSLIRSATGEIWNYLMYDCVNTEDCDTDPPYNPNYCLHSGDIICVPLTGCGTWMAYIYFFSFILIISSILVQLFIGVILDGFGDISHSENSMLTPEQFEQFVRAWNEFDIDAKCSIPLSQLDDLFSRIPPPMGFPEELIGEDRRRKIAKMKIPMYKRDNGEPRVYFSDVVLACAKRIVEDDLREKGNDNFNIELPADHRAVKAWNRKYRKMKHITNRDIEYNIRHYYSVLKLITAYQLYKFRNNMKKNIILQSPNSRAVSPKSNDSYDVNNNNEYIINKEKIISPVSLKPIKLNVKITFNDDIKPYSKSNNNNNNEIDANSPNKEEEEEDTYTPITFDLPPIHDDKLEIHSSPKIFNHPSISPQNHSLPNCSSPIRNTVQSSITDVNFISPTKEEIINNENSMPQL